MQLLLHPTQEEDPKRIPQKHTQMASILVTYPPSPPEIPGEALQISLKLHLSCEPAVSATDALDPAVIFTCTGTSLSLIFSSNNYFFFVGYFFFSFVSKVTDFSNFLGWRTDAVSFQIACNKKFHAIDTGVFIMKDLCF